LLQSLLSPKSGLDQATSLVHEKPLSVQASLYDITVRQRWPGLVFAYPCA
jgi:hypothetical protein